jgi:hypothetical protein
MLREQLRGGPKDPHAAALDAAASPQSSAAAARRGATEGGGGGAASGRRRKAQEEMTLEALQRQLQDGDLDLSAIEGLLDQMTSLSGLMRLLKTHSSHMRQARGRLGWLSKVLTSVGRGHITRPPSRLPSRV